MLIQHVVVISINWRNGVAAVSHSLRGMTLSGWDSNLWNLANWHKA